MVIKGVFLKVFLLSLFLSLSIYAAPVQVASLATSGNGTAASPWLGWESLAVVDGVQYIFNNGEWYACAISPNWLKPGVAIIGNGANFKHIGTGDAFVMDAGAGQFWVNNARVENLHIWGNANTRHGMYLRGVRDALFSQIEIRDVPQAGVWSEACVTNIMQNLIVHYHPLPGWTIRPKYGMVTTGRGADWSTTWTITNSVLEGIELGLWFKDDSYGNTVINGTSEGNDKGDLVEGNYNTFTNRDNEANWGSGIDWEIKGSYNQLISVFSQTLIKITGSHNIISGGHIQNLDISSTGGAAYYNILQGPKVLGVFTDTGNHTIYYGLIGGNLTTKLGKILPQSSYPTITNGVVDTNVLLADFFAVFVGESFTLANPTNAIDGQKVTWKFTTNGSTQWTITYGNKFRGKSGVFPAMSFAPTAPASWWYLTARYNAAQQTWDIVDYSY